MKTKKKDEKKFMILAIFIGLIAVALLLMALKGGGGLPNPFSSGGNTPQEDTGDSGKYNLFLDLSPNIICLGDSTLGTITSNMPLATCVAYTNTGGGWQPYIGFTLNNGGGYSEPQVVNQAGHAFVKVVCCDDDNNCKVSNTEELTIQACDTTTTTTTIPSHQCYDSDGGINYAVWGYCEDDYHMAGFADTCEDGQLKEYYCDSESICQVRYGGSCGWGATCSAIKYPTSQGSCNEGYCNVGMCVYIPATLSTPAYCGCATML